MDYLIIGGLVFEVVALSHIDHRLFRTWFTPFNLLAWPYTVIVVLAFLFTPHRCLFGSLAFWYFGLPDLSFIACSIVDLIALLGAMRLTGLSSTIRQPRSRHQCQSLSCPFSLLTFIEH